MCADVPDLSRLDYLEPAFTQVGLALETSQEAWAGLWELPAVRAIAYVDVPSRFNPYPFSTVGIGRETCPYGLYLALIEYLARFDANCLMALPGSSLCTRVILTLGTESQVEAFFDRFRSRASPHSAFLAITEPHGGSDATAVRSRVSGSSKEKRLNAVKTLIGGARRASVGLVFARAEGEQLCFVMIEPSRCQDKITFEPLSLFGLAGAGLCRVVIRECPIRAEQVIGGERKSLRDGFNAILNVFDRHRPMIGALALGAGRGLLNALERTGVSPEALATHKHEHAALCQRMNRIGTRYEKGQLRLHEASLFKLDATRFAERVARTVPLHLSAAALMSFPGLRKKYRDVFAFEYMEGTSNVQVLNAYRAYVASREHYDAAS